MRPPTRRRSSRSLTLTEREEISRGVVAGLSLRSIAVKLGRAPSTVSRELRRNGDRNGYRASSADEAAWDRACRPKICKLAGDRALARKVAVLSLSNLLTRNSCMKSVHTNSQFLEQRLKLRMITQCVEIWVHL